MLNQIYVQITGRTADKTGKLLANCQNDGRPVFDIILKEWLGHNSHQKINY